MIDRRLLCLSAGLRAAAVGLSGVVLALHLTTLHFEAGVIGLAVSLGLAGCALGTAIVTWVADRLGRRTTLVTVSGLMALGGVMLALTARRNLVLVSIGLGMVNGMGRDRGASGTIEQAMLPQTATDEGRTRAFAWYNLTIDAGHAIGSLVGGLPAWLRQRAALAPLASYQWTWGVYALLCVAAGMLASRLSPSLEPRASTPSRGLSRTSRPRVVTFAALSGLDSLGGGFLTTALLSFWFFRRFGVDEAFLAPLFFTVRVLNGLSHLVAAWLARRVGLLNTMVFTHVPSSLLLMTVPWAPSLGVAVALFLVRESLVEMDVPTRQSYLMAIVGPEERTRAGGIANLTRGTAWAIAPGVAGSLMQGFGLGAPLLVGPALKLVYDALLFRAFRHLRPPEESRG